MQIRKIEHYGIIFMKRGAICLKLKILKTMMML